MATTAAQVAVLSQSPGEQPDGKDWWSMAAKRTKAMPQHSLFGTSLEQYDRENLMHTEGRFIPEGYIKPVPNRYPLPDYIKKSIPGRDALESSRRDLQQQHTLLAKTDKQLKAKAQQALTFNELGPCSNTPKSQSSQPSWFKDSDLKHSNEINIVGLNPRGSYNRDKYGPKPRRHNYSLIGDIMAKSMDFNTPIVADNEHLVEAYKKGQRNSWGPGRHLPHDLMEQSVSKNKKPSQSLVNLPSNIRHMFGSRVCDTLLSDKQLVDVALERQRALSGPARPSRRECVDSLPVDLEGNYESLGQATRYNVCPGLSTGHTISRTKLDFNTEVHQKRVPGTDEYRYQRDELSIWREQDVLRRRRAERWQSYLDTLPKFMVNWDRGAKRPVMEPKPVIKPPPKQKVKSRQQKVQEPQLPQEEEDIIFVTPPLTPPPMREELVEMPKDFERDEEFWKFFDQSVPK